MAPGRRLWLGSDPNVHFAFAAVALLLVLVNLMVPALLEGLAAGPTFLGQGSLKVALGSGENLTFAFESQGNVEFLWVHVGLNLSAGPVGPQFPGNATTPRTYHWTNSTDLLASSFSVPNATSPSRSSFVVNVTAETSAALSEGTFAFLYQYNGAIWTLTAYPIWPLHGSVTLPEGPGAITWDDTDLPQALLLAQGPVPGPSGAAPLGAARGPEASGGALQ